MRQKSIQSAVAWASLGLLAVFASATLGCAGVQVKKESLDKVNTIALAGYTIVTDFKDSGSKSEGVLGQINAVKKTAELASGDFHQKREERALETYDLLAQRIQERLHWEVTRRETMTAHDGYQRLYHQLVTKDPSSQIASSLGPNLHVPDVVWHEKFEQMEVADRQRLIEELGVDALATVKVTYRIGKKEGFAVAGVGDQTFFPQAVVEFTLYDANSSEPIWSDRWAQGDPASKGFRKIAGVDDDSELTAAMIEAADLGYQKLLERYQQG